MTEKEKHLTLEQQKAVIEAVKSTGEMLLALWPGSGASRRDLNIQTRSDGAKATKADRLASGSLLDALSRIFPHDLVLSEETAAAGAAERPDRVWFLDPLDGTAAFINGEPEFSSFAALCVEGKPVFAVIGRPAAGLLGVALRPGRVKINGKRAHVSQRLQMAANRIAAVNLDLEQGEEHNMRCAEALWGVATGDMDAALIRLSRRHKAWDFAALTAFIRAGGGQVTDERGRGLRFHQPSLPCSYVVASNGKHHQALLELLWSTI